jgi:hypothetical protein
MIFFVGGKNIGLTEKNEFNRHYCHVRCGNFGGFFIENIRQ